MSSAVVALLRLSCHAMIAPPAPSETSCGRNWEIAANETAMPIALHCGTPARFTRWAKTWRTAPLIRPDGDRSAAAVGDQALIERITWAHGNRDAAERPKGDA